MKTKADEFLKIVDEIYGFYLDCTFGFSSLLSNLSKVEKKVRSQGDVLLDDLSFYYGKGHPNEKNSSIFHMCSQGELKERNRDNGKNYRLAANYLIVLIYQYWEDYYREKIADEIGLGSKNDLVVPIMGDLRILRCSIIHNRGKAIKEVKNCEILRWFEKGDEIMIDKNRVEEILICIHLSMVDIIKKIGVVY